MRHGEFFRLTRSAVAIAQRGSRNSAILIPAEAVIEVLGGPFDGVRLMDVRFEGEIIMMFTNDMEHHTEPIKANEINGLARRSVRVLAKAACGGQDR